MDFLPDIEKFKNFFDGTDSKNEISIAVEEAKKYDIFNLISRVSALNLFHQNQTKSVILDTYIEGVLCQTIINMFNIAEYDATHHPIQAYSSKAKMLELYLKDPESYRKYVNIMPDIFDLYDAVELEFAEAYNTGGGRYGRKKYAGFDFN